MNMLDIYVHITVQCVTWSASWTKSQTQKCFFCAGKGSNHSTFFTVSTCQLGKCFMHYCWYMSLSGFFTILPYLVLTMFPLYFVLIVHPCVRTYFLCCFLCCLVLFYCLPHVHLHILLSSLSLYIALSVYVGGFFNVIKNGIQWVCFCMSISLITM